jgi:tetratricopeptide (TPR) repeat protein
MMPKKLLAGLLFYSSVVFACTWDTDTLRDEAVANPSRFDILTGQFAHHGMPYYQHRIETLVTKEFLTQAEQNDLAVAYMKVGEFDKSEQLLVKILDDDPGFYPGLSNRGVLAKKQGDYDTAIEYIGKALELNPDGHMGLGDWYLKMLEWRKAVDEDPNYEGDFLDNHEGDSFAGFGLGEEKKDSLNREQFMDRLFALVKNDQTFADGFYVLGRELANQDDFNLAFIAIHRARDLGHPKLQEIEGELTMDNTGWMVGNESFGPASQSFGDAMGSHSRLDEKTVRETLQIAKEWREKYDRAEIELLKQGVEPTFAAMKSETNIHEKKFRPEEPTEVSTIFFRAVVLLLGSMVLVTGGLLIIRKRIIKRLGRL